MFSKKFYLGLSTMIRNTKLSPVLHFVFFFSYVHSLSSKDILLSIFPTQPLGKIRLFGGRGNYGMRNQSNDLQT